MDQVIFGHQPGPLYPVTDTPPNSYFTDPHSLVLSMRWPRSRLTIQKQGSSKVPTTTLFEAGARAICWGKSRYMRVKPRYWLKVPSEAFIDAMATACQVSSLFIRHCWIPSTISIMHLNQAPWLCRCKYSSFHFSAALLSALSNGSLVVWPLSSNISLSADMLPSSQPLEYYDHSDQQNMSTLHSLGSQNTGPPFSKTRNLQTIIDEKDSSVEVELQIKINKGFSRSIQSQIGFVIDVITSRLPAHTASSHIVIRHPNLCI